MGVGAQWLPEKPVQMKTTKASIKARVQWRCGSRNKCYRWKGLTDMMKFDSQATWKGAQGLSIGHRWANERVEDKIWVGLIVV